MAFLEVGIVIIIEFSFVDLFSPIDRTEDGYDRLREAGSGIFHLSVLR